MTRTCTPFARACLTAAIMASGSLLYGCASAPQASSEAVALALPPLAAPIAGQPSVAMVQQLEITHGSDTRTLICALELTGRASSVAALTTAGFEVFSVQHTASGLDITRSPLVPAVLDPRAVMADVQLAFWPSAQLLALNTTRWRYDMGINSRRLYDNDVLVAEVQYAAPDGASDPQAAPIVLRNLRFGYMLTITTLQRELLPPEPADRAPGV